MENIHSTIVELGSVFKQLAEMVKEQEETVMRYNYTYVRVCSPSWHNGFQTQVCLVHNNADFLQSGTRVGVIHTCSSVV